MGNDVAVGGFCVRSYADRGYNRHGDFYDIQTYSIF